MGYRHNIPCFTQESAPLVAAGANNTYIVGKKRILRIVPAADTYVVQFSDKTLNPVASSTTGMLLKANQEYFIDTGDYDFLNASTSTSNIVQVRQEGMARY